MEKSLLGRGECPKHCLIVLARFIEIQVTVQFIDQLGCLNHRSHEIVLGDTRQSVTRKKTIDYGLSSRAKIIIVFVIFRIFRIFPEFPESEL